MLVDLPVVSVVTPTRNAGRFVKETIKSVLAQRYPQIEYIVVDSYSTDDTQAILASYGERIRVVSAPVLGPAAAIHTGLLEARGAILGWLNADDTYAVDAVETAVAAFKRHPEADLIYGESAWMDEHGEVIRRYPTVAFDRKALARDCFISQPSVFFRASAYRDCYLDVSLGVSFDYDLWIRMDARGKRFQQIPECLSYTRMHRNCITLDQRREVFEVTMALLKKHYEYVPLSWVFGYLSFLRDGRDQFFEPLHPSASVFLASLPRALALNCRSPLRVISEWTSTMARGLRRGVTASGFR